MHLLVGLSVGPTRLTFLAFKPVVNAEKANSDGPMDRLSQLLSRVHTTKKDHGSR